jgi:hypothetical protein
MINFRNTLYVVNDRMTLDCELGRPTLSRAVFQSEIADKIIVMDRIGSLGKTFKNVLDLAMVCMYVCMYVCMLLSVCLNELFVSMFKCTLLKFTLYFIIGN